MTFLLFLISLAALQQILRRSVPRRRGDSQPSVHPRADQAAPAEVPAEMPGLLALGRALDQYGRSPAARAAPADAPSAIRESGGTQQLKV
jgi:hypothetical protein